MKKIMHFVKLIKTPRKIVSLILIKISRFIKNDSIYIRLDYLINTGKRLNLDNPTSFNEKLQWLKLNCKREEYTQRVDKYLVKKYVSNLIGESCLIPTYGVWDNFDDIDFSKLPNQFVLKCTHDSGGLVICENKKDLDIPLARKKINKSLKKSFFYSHREYPYKGVRPRIIAEEYMVDESGCQLKDYKIFCFHGEPKFIEVDYDRFVGHKLNVYDLNWNFLDFYMTSPNDKSIIIEKPKNLDTMIEWAKVLSKDDIFVRVDFYSINEKIYFGELTYHPGAGLIDFHPKDWDYRIGEMLKLPI